MGNSCGRGSAVAPEQQEAPPKHPRRGSSLNGEHAPPHLGTTETEDLLILESAEREGLSSARGRAGPSQHAQVLLLGASAVGKTTLLRSMVHNFDGQRVRCHLYPVAHHRAAMPAAEA